MKRTYLFITLTVIVGLHAAATDRFYIESFSIAPGETQQLSILLDNEAAYTAFQSDLYLSDGLMATSFALTARKSSNHTLTATVLPDGGIRLLSYSFKLKTYSGNSGALVTFEVTASDDFVAPSVITLRNTLFTTEEGMEVSFDDEECTITLGLRGDINMDNAVNMDDLTVLINYLLTNDDSLINIANAASCNNPDNDIVDMDDLTALINYLLTNTWQ